VDVPTSGAFSYGANDAFSWSTITNIIRMSLNITGLRVGDTSLATSMLDVQGSAALKSVDVAISSNTDDEVFINITDTASPRTITILTADIVKGRIFIISDASQFTGGTGPGAGTNNITITTEGSEEIDRTGNTNAVISVNEGVVRLYVQSTTHLKSF